MEESEIPVEELYDKIKKKFSLPDFGPLDNEFEISTIEDEKFLLRQVAKKISERLQNFQNIFADVLNPDINSLAVLHESKFFDDVVKEKLFIAYQKLMLLQRKFLEADVLLDDKNTAKLINDAWIQYPSIKQETKLLVEQLKHTWEKALDPKEELRYFG
ncbi:hypothetical protein J4457_06870 [Candidatus Woesearchaeota archaeon]|nr:hypothetical protein [Candidatus Woesearchaeota archaeon]